MFFRREMDLRVKIFNVLAIAGVLTCTTIFLTALFTGAGLVNPLTCAGAGALSLFLLLYSAKSGRYRFCYMVTIVVIFLILFPVMFFSAGGYHSGMPCFFVFAVVFTVYMLDGVLGIVMSVLEMLTYAGVCLFAYYRPQGVVTLDSEQALLADIIAGFITASLVLGATMYIQFRMYQHQQRQLELARAEAEEASRAKGNFLAKMSHELRTPINVILGMNEMILRSAPAGEIGEYSAKIRSAGDMLLSIISNILDITKIESGRLELAQRPYRTADLISELAILGREPAQKKGLAFTVEADDSLPAVLSGDVAYIRQIVTNFLSNAVKYTRRGRVILRAGQKPGRSPGTILLCLSVADTGAGIKSEHLDGLFEAFRRIDLPVYAGIEGAGLGLAIAKDLTERMGGHIFVQSVYGDGSTFGVELPQCVEDAAPMGGRNSTEMQRESGERSFVAPEGRVLVVDDSRENLDVVKFLLERTMLHIDTAGSGREAVALARERHYHVILMDYMMPEMDGIAALGLLQEEKLLEGTSVVALTANAVAGTEKQLLGVGFSAYLAKPVKWQDLEQTLCSFLPESLVSRADRGETGMALSGELRQELSAALAEWDIDLDEALHYLSGDLRQYGKLAQLSIQCYPAQRSRMERLLALQDWENLTFEVHSLRSGARGLGARELHDVAARMERRCRVNDADYLTRSAPLLLLEWERANRGLRELSRRLQELFPQAAAPGFRGDERARQACIKLTADALRSNIWLDAGEGLRRLLADEADEKGRRTLLRVLDSVESLHFRQAEDLFAYYLEERRSEND
jgi:signal transduction histidine kinase/DNA-binding response OmpR family regulator